MKLQTSIVTKLVNLGNKWKEIKVEIWISFILIEFAVENVKYQESLVSDLFEIWQCYQMLVTI